MPFDTFFGSPVTTERLQRSIEQGVFPQATLLAGEAGLGKKTLALLLAKSLLCAQGATVGCCCTNCYKAAQNIHPDLLYLAQPADKDPFEKGLCGLPVFYDPPQNMKPLTVDLVRKIAAHAVISPNEANKKIYIVDASHGMNMEAQNAFLKLLEEPPHHIWFILLATRRAALLETILSRVQTFSIRPLTKEDFLRAFVQKGGEMTQADDLYTLSGGNLGQALALSNTQADDQTATLAQAYFSALREGNLLTLLQFGAKLEKATGRDRARLKSVFAFLRKICYLSIQEGASSQLAVAGTQVQIGDYTQTVKWLHTLPPAARVALFDCIDLYARQNDANVTIPAVIAAFSVASHQALSPKKG